MDTDTKWAVSLIGVLLVIVLGVGFYEYKQVSQDGIRLYTGVSNSSGRNFDQERSWVYNTENECRHDAKQYVNNPHLIPLMQRWAVCRDKYDNILLEEVGAVGIKGERYVKEDD